MNGRTAKWAESAASSLQLPSLCQLYTMWLLLAEPRQATHECVTVSEWPPRRCLSGSTPTGHPPAPPASTAERLRGHTALPRPSPAPSVCTPRRPCFRPWPTPSLQAALNRPAARRCVHWHACRRPRPAQPLQISARVLELACRSCAVSIEAAEPAAAWL